MSLDTESKVEPPSSKPVTREPVQPISKYEGELSISKFTYEVVTIRIERSGGILGFGGKVEVLTNRQSKEARLFVENFENGTQLEMVFIPGGTFQMGSPLGEGDDDEHPQHLVTVDSFRMGRYAVTQAQYLAVMGKNPSRFKDSDRLPVENVGWNDAKAFCDRLSTMTGKECRLPSEAEWEYACRAGTTTPFHFGKMITTELANYDGNYTYGSGPKGVYRQKTTPEDNFGVANAFGLCDMHGNVWEWCEDDWHDSYEGAPVDGSAWIEASVKNRSKVLRGGSWFNLPRNCRSASRNGLSCDGINFNVGFRVCCVPPRVSS